jgi:hypothetical protein
VPRFVVGREGYDNWLVDEAYHLRIIRIWLPKSWIG